jgi:hypothetical protein
MKELKDLTPKEYEDVVVDFVKRHGFAETPSGNMRTDIALKEACEKGRLIKDGDKYYLKK